MYLDDLRGLVMVHNVAADQKIQRLFINKQQDVEIYSLTVFLESESSPLKINAWTSIFKSWMYSQCGC